MLNSPYRWESAAPPRFPSEPRWSPAGTRWTGRPRSSAAACRSGCGRPARLCAEPSDRACPQRSPGVRRAAVNTNLTAHTTRRDAYEQNTTTDLRSVFLQHLQDVVVSSLSSDVQWSHEATRHNRQEVKTCGYSLCVQTVIPAGS